MSVLKTTTSCHNISNSSLRSPAVHRISHQPGWLTSCNTGLKVISAHRSSPAHVIRPFVFILVDVFSGSIKTEKSQKNFFTLPENTFGERRLSCTRLNFGEFFLRERNGQSRFRCTALSFRPRCSAICFCCFTVAQLSVGNVRSYDDCCNENFALG